MEQREAIWSVWRQYRGLYSGVFVILLWAGVGFIVANGVQQGEPWLERLLEAVQYLAAVVVGAAGVSLGTTELWRFLMVLAECFEEWLERRRERQRKEAIEKGLEEGRSEADKLWEAWVERRDAAREAGESFDEPMPSALRRSARERDGAGDSDGRG